MTIKMKTTADRDEEQLELLYEEWLTFHGTEAREAMAKFRPWKPYRLEETGQIVKIVSYGDDGTFTVFVDPEHNPPERLSGFEVFGIAPDKLKPYPPLAA